MRRATGERAGGGEGARGRERADARERARCRRRRAFARGGTPTRLPSSVSMMPSPSSELRYAARSSWPVLRCGELVLPSQV